MERSYRVLIADDDALMCQKLKEFLVEKGFETKLVSNGREFREIVPVYSPHFVLLDLTLPEGNAISLLDWISSEPEIKKKAMKVLVTSSHNSIQNVKTCLAAGAADYLIRPFQPEDIARRLVFHINSKRQISESDNDRKVGAKAGSAGQDVFLHLTDLMLRETLVPQPVHGSLFNILKMLSITLKAVRCSAIQCDVDQLKGTVLASSDDKLVKDIQLDLSRYPEVLHVVSTEKIVVIENMDYDPILAEIKKQIKGISFNSMVVCPIRRQGKFFGVISARIAKESQTLNDNEIRFARLVSYAISLVLERLPEKNAAGATTTAPTLAS